MIYIVEIPYVGKPRCYTALDTADAVRRFMSIYNTDTYQPARYFIDWLSYNRGTLADQFVFMTDDEALDAVGELAKRGFSEVSDLLRETLIEYCVLEVKP